MFNMFVSEQNSERTILASEHVPILFEMLRKRTLFASKYLQANKMIKLNKLIILQNDQNGHFSNWPKWSFWMISQNPSMYHTVWFIREHSWIFPTASHQQLNSEAPNKHTETISEWFRVLVLSFSLINWLFQSPGRTFIVRKINGKSPALSPAAWPAAVH